MSELALTALAGSRVQEGIVAHVWYDGRLVTQEPLPVASWSMSSDATRQVKSQVKLSVADADGSLVPWALNDPLGVGGPQVQMLYTMGRPDTLVDLGWFRTVESAPVENWVFKKAGERTVQVSGGARISITADDLTTMAVDDKFLAPESPAAGATFLSEVRRILRDIVPVTVAAGVADRPVSTSVVFDKGTPRIDTVEDLLKEIGATHRMTGDRQLEVIPLVTDDVAWEVRGGDGGVLVDVQRAQSVRGLYNGAVSEGADDDGRPLIGRAFESAGPLRWGGPHGRRPIFHTATGILKTQAAVDADAKTRLAGVVSERTITLPVTCLPHPGLQVHDRVLVASPNITGADIDLVGTVRSIDLRGSTAGVSPMEMTVECSYEDVQLVAAAIRRAS